MKAQLFTVSVFLVSMALLALLVPDGDWLAAAQSQPTARPALISAAPTTENVEFVGHIGGTFYDVKVSGSRAYVAA